MVERVAELGERPDERAAVVRDLDHVAARLPRRGREVERGAMPAAARRQPAAGQRRLDRRVLLDVTAAFRQGRQVVREPRQLAGELVGDVLTDVTQDAGRAARDEDPRRRLGGPLVRRDEPAAAVEPEQRLDVQHGQLGWVCHERIRDARIQAGATSAPQALNRRR